MVKTTKKEQINADKKKKRSKALRKQLKRFSKTAKKTWQSAKPHLKKIGGSPEFLAGALADPGKSNQVSIKEPKKKQRASENNINTLLGLK
jgi:hypothetical protein